VKDVNGDLLADSHNTVNRWKNYYSQLFNVHPCQGCLVPDPSPFEVEIAIEKLQRFIYYSNHQLVNRSQHNLFKQEVK
jgi:hypothetical protein